MLACIDGAGEVSDNSITFLSFVGQVFLPFSVKHSEWLGMRRGREKKNLFPYNAHVFLLRWEVAPCFQIVLAARVQRVQGLPWVRSASGSAPNICSKLQTRPDLETRQLVQQMANSPAPLGPEIGTIFVLQPRQPHSCYAWAQKAFMAF